MSYTALYRKFRPQTFSEMSGQEAITKTLKNQIKSNRVGHAYLFTGVRGTGKTSAAKILARAINCTNPQDGEPCNECEICKSALNASLTDIVEMDAASNNGVEDIRNIREEVNFLPTLAKYRIYIIDEVHMLSTGAFNALLKTLEEPPEHAKFILATTEPQKLPATILSRCQRFDFKKISIKDIIERLNIICKESNIQITKEGLNLIAVLSEGALRDAISILERTVQDGETKITEEKIKDLVGIPKITNIYNIVNAIIEYNPIDALKTIDEISEQGQDVENFLWEIIKYIKDILIYKNSKSLEIYSKDEIEQIKQLSENVSNERLIQLINSLSELQNSLKFSTQKQILFQTGIIRACSKTENQGIEELQKRIEMLEETIKNGSVKIETTQKPVKQEKPKTEEKPTKKEEPKKTKVTEQKDTNSVPYWNNVLERLKKSGKYTIYMNLINTSAKEISDNVLQIEFKGGINAFGKAVLEKQENVKEIQNLIKLETGKDMKISLSKETEQKEEAQENKMSDLDIPINIIEE